jgi:hypothetical protein
VVVWRERFDAPILVFKAKDPPDRRPICIVPGPHKDALRARGRRSAWLAVVAAALACLIAPAAALGTAYAPAKGKAFHGVSDTGEVGGFTEFATEVGAHPAVMQTFHTWGTFPSLAMQRWDATDTRGMISVSTAKGYEEPEVLSPEAIANGEGDNYPLNLNTAIAQWDQPVYIRLLAEMNGEWNPYCAYNRDGSFRGPAHSPTQYRLAWKRFALIVRGGPVSAINDRLQRLGMPPIQAAVPPTLPVPKVALMWVPHSSPTPNVPGNSWENYWPGRKYVDWVGTDIFSTAPNWKNMRRIYEDFNGKPFLIGEYAPLGEDDASYVKKLFGFSRRHKRAKLLVYYQGFGNDPIFDISRFPAALDILRSRLGGPRFLQFAPEAPGNGPGGVTPGYAYGPRATHTAGIETASGD